MIIETIELHNWLRYAGVQLVAFGGSVYSVTARLDSNADRSNWLGKSSFLASIPFALYGKHEKATEDEWITYGASDGGVTLTLSTGVVISRRRQRGRTTNLIVTMPDCSELKGKEAQEEIDRIVGMNAAEFFAAVFIKQKRLDAFVRATSGQRMQMLRDWLDLEKIEKAEDSLVDRLTRERQQENDIVRSIENAKTHVESVLRKHFEFGSLSEIDFADAIGEIDQLIQEARAEEKALQIKNTEARVRLAEADRVRERDAAEIAWKRHREELEGIGELPDFEAVQDRIQALADEASAARRKRTEAAALACGSFDGVCPIDGHQCSDAHAMLERRAANAALKVLADERFEKVAEELRIERERFAMLSKKRSRYSELTAIADELMRRYEFGKRVDSPTETPSELKERLISLESLQRNAIEKTVGLERDKKTIQEQVHAMHEFETRLKEAGKRVQVLGHAVRIIGRTGLQRVLCERARESIETRSNAMLADAGIALQISLTWQREGKGLSKNCQECGTAFLSKTAKKCVQCGAERTANVINELDVNLSDRSGAAEDLAGCAIQMAAAQFLREQRGSAWATLCIDEPFGALDSQNRKDLSRHLVGMVRGGLGFEQAFIVAHDRALMDALPARVEVLADAKSSSLEVRS